jgi:hypothetical protein
MFSFRSAVVTIGLILVALFSFSLPHTGAQQNSPETVQKSPDQTLFEDSHRIAQQIEVVGPKLIAILDDDSAPIADRLRAATLLGKLKYRPGIPVLIKHIELFDKFKITSDGPDYDCMLSLVEYGEAAMPAVIEAFLAINSDDQTREHLLRQVIGVGRLAKVAVPYCKGLAPDEPNLDYERRLAQLMKYLQQ